MKAQALEAWTPATLMGALLMALLSVPRAALTVPAALTRRRA
jgi:hypothetical protein